MRKDLKIIPFNLFPTMVVKIPGFLDREQIKDALEQIETYTAEERREMDGSINAGNSKAAISSFGNITERHILKELTTSVPSCKDLVQNIQHCLNEYTNVHHMKNVIVTNSWFNIMDKGSILAYHVHAYSILSGAIYLKKELGVSDITFKNPNPYARMTSTTPWDNTPGSVHAQVAAETGDLVIFPSWLEHGTDHLSSLNDRRVVMSFNSNFLVY